MKLLFRINFIFLCVKRTIILLSTIFLFIFSACKKDKSTTPEEIDTPVITDTASKEIILGNEQEMHITKWDYILHAGISNSLATYSLDVDSDGADDLKFTVYMTKYPMMGIHYENTVMSLNSSIQLSGYIETDTNFILTTIKVSTTSAQVQVDTSRLISCTRLTPTQTVLDIVPDQFKLLYSDKGTLLKKDGVYQTGSDPIVNTNANFSEIISTTPDTMIIRRTTITNDCDAPAQGEVKYIGFKINTAKGIKMGWIKLILLNRDKIHILESAIQN